MTVCKFPDFYRSLLIWLGLPEFFCTIPSFRFVSTTERSLLLLTTHSPPLQSLCELFGVALSYADLRFWCLLLTFCTWFTGPLMTKFMYLFAPQFLFTYCHVDQFRCCDYNSQCHTQISYSVLAFILSVPNNPWAITFIMTIISIKPPEISQ